MRWAWIGFGTERVVGRIDRRRPIAGLGPLAERIARRGSIGGSAEQCVLACHVPAQCEGLLLRRCPFR